MIVQENLKILADDNMWKQLFVMGLKFVTGRPSRDRVFQTSGWRCSVHNCGVTSRCM